jgi:hypothetical protein
MEGYVTKMAWSFTDASALWQARNGNTKSAATVAAWDYIESRLQGCDVALANARIDDPEEES